MLILDSGGVSRLAERSRDTVALILALRRRDLWPPIVPSVVLVECVRGHPGKDVAINAILRICDITEDVPERLARRAAQLRSQAKSGSAVDALVVALGEPGGVVLTSDLGDLGALAEYADFVRIERV